MQPFPAPRWAWKGGPWQRASLWAHAAVKVQPRKQTASWAFQWRVLNAGN